MQPAPNKSKNASFFFRISIMLAAFLILILAFLVQFKPDLMDPSKPNIYFYKSPEQRAYYKTRGIDIPEQGWTAYDLINKNIRQLTDIPIPLWGFCLRHPIAAWKTRNLTKIIDIETKKRFNNKYFYNNDADAYRHFIWAVLTSVEIGESLAKQVLEKYEDYPDNPTKEKNMDLFNNQKGFEYYDTLSISGRPTSATEAIEKASQAAIDEINNKQLQTQLN